MAEIITNYNQNKFSLLREKSKNVIFPLSEEVKNLISDMKTIVKNDINIIGLHAVQVGFPQRLFIVIIHNKPRVFINTELLYQEGRKKHDEGCMSIPGTFLRIERPKMVRVKYFDESGQEHTGEFHNLTARCIAHELGHEKGQTILDFIIKSN